MRHRRGWRRQQREPRADGEAVPLTELDPGEAGVVVDLGGGSWVLGRLASLGFTPGAGVRVVQNRGHGPLIACVRDVRVALGRHQARMIVVRRTAE